MLSTCRGRREVLPTDPPREARVSRVVDLEIVTADGVRAVADRSGLHPVDPRDGVLIARLEADLKRLIAAHLGTIRTELGRIPRQVSGYQLHHLLPENGFDLAHALVGTEGTCAVVTAATVRLMATAQASTLLTLGYDDVVAAAEDVPEILRWSPSAVEGMDEAIVATMRTRRGSVRRSYRYALPLSRIPFSSVTAFSSSSSSLGSRDRGIHADQVEIDLSTGRRLSDHSLHQRPEGPGHRPTLERAANGRPGAVFLRQVPPRAPARNRHITTLNNRRRSGTGPRSPTGKNGSTNSHSASERSLCAALDN
jgi:hypothetical protein